MIQALNIPENMVYIFKEPDLSLGLRDNNKIEDIYAEICKLDKEPNNKGVISGFTTSALYWLQVAAERRIPVSKAAYDKIMEEADEIIRTFSPKNFQIQFKDGVIDRIKTKIYPDVFAERCNEYINYMVTEMIELTGQYLDGTPIEIKFELETISDRICPPTNIIVEALMEASHSAIPKEDMSIEDFVGLISDSIQKRMVEDGYLRQMIILLNGTKMGYKGY